MHIGSYEVLLELARGGMGKVYLARSVGPRGVERLVAIKRAHEHLLGASKAVADRFLDEARIAAHIHHSNVVGVHQAGSDEDGYYLVLDYVEGISLDGLIDAAQERGARVPPQIVLRVVCDALAGLHAAHEATDSQGRALGILHRDVSTQNLLVGRDGVTRLSDFGIAKSAVSLVVTDELYVQGKLVYMSPEYLQRKPVDRTVDVYAVGITLFFALSGDIPWPGADERQLLSAILVSGVPSLAARAPELGPEIIAVVDRACSLDAGQRFATARAMLDALEQASRAIGGLARHVEVAEFVEEFAGKELAERRELVKKRRAELRAAPDDSVAMRAPAREAPVELHERADGWVPDEPKHGTDASPRKWEERLPWKVMATVAFVAAVLVVLIVALRRGGSRDAERSNAAAAAPPHAASAITPEPAPAATATEAPVVAPARAAPSEPTPAPRTRRKPPAKPATETVPFSTANPYR